MAVSNQLISNPVTGQDIRFIRTAADTKGKLLEMEAVYHSRSREPPAHYHPCQEEDFAVLEGELKVYIHGHYKVLRAGDTLHIGTNEIHAMWNDSDDTTIVNWKVRPAMNTEHLLETISGLASDGKVNAGGMPGILQIALIANKYNRVFRLSKPPFAVQKMVFALLTPFAYLFGYRPTYKKYLAELEQ